MAIHAVCVTGRLEFVRSLAANYDLQNVIRTGDVVFGGELS